MPGESNQPTSQDPWLENIEEHIPKPKPHLKEQLITDKQLQSLYLPPIDWLYPQLIPNPGLIAFAGRPGSYKTFFAHWLAIRLANGQVLFDQVEAENQILISGKPPPTPVLFVEEEMSLRQMKDRAMILKNNQNTDNLYYLTSSSFKLRDPIHREELKTAIREHSIKVLILDPFSSVSGMTDENNNAEAAEIMDIIRHEFIHDDEFGLTIIFIHHPSKNSSGKDSNLRGAGDILGKCDMALTFDAHEGTSQVTIRYKKSRDLAFDQMDPFTIELRKQDITQTNPNPTHLEWVLIESDFNDDQATKKDMVKKDILEILENENGVTRKEVGVILGMSSNNNTFQRAWNDLKEEKLIHYRNKQFYSEEY
jgi:hypothetical protein